MRLLRSALLLALPLALLGCESGRYAVEVSFAAGASAEDAATIELLLLDACPGNAEVLSGARPVDGVLQSLELDRAQQPLPRLDPVGPGEYGLYARALGSSCDVFASACVPVKLEAGGSSTLPITLTASAPLEACAATEVCSEGHCLPTGDKVALRVGAGRAHSCALFTNSEVWCWGDNSFGQLGQGHAEPLDAPVRVGEPQWQKLSVGWDHACAIDLVNRLHCWGREDDGRLGHAEGASLRPAQVGTRADWQVVSASARTTCGRAGYDAYCWGANEVGQLGVGDTAPRTEPTAVDVDNFAGYPIAAGGNATTGHMAVVRHEIVSVLVIPLGRRFDVYTAGAGLAGGDRATPASILENVESSTQLSAGGAHTCLVSASRVYCGGANELRQLGRDDSAAPAQIGDADDWTQVAAGALHTCGRRGTTVWCWGDNAAGQTGGAEALTSAPAQVGSLDGWTWVSAGVDHSCGVRGGLVFCWGSNDANRSGLGVGVAGQTAPVASVAFP